MMKLKYWLFGTLILAIIGITFVVFIQQEKLSENKKENFERGFEEIEKTKDANEKMEEGNIALTNTGVKLTPTPQRGTSSQGGSQMQSQYMKSEVMNVTAGQRWNKNTKLKYCFKYKSNASYRSTILSASSSLRNKYFFQINVWKDPSDHPCSQWAFAKSLWDKGKGRGTYSINISPKASLSNEDVFHEICIDDINSQLNHCASKWGISEDDAYLTNIYQVSINSSASSSVIFDYVRIFVDGNQISESLFPNQDFSKFSGLADDDSSDDFVGWTEHSDIYAVDIKE
ncbi:MAG: hypothetical protein U9N04_00305 [Patescibacteria group bacterium]|nr:hypothetical protein [Patescibacteria group bacterium]